MSDVEKDEIEAGKMAQEFVDEIETMKLKVLHRNNVYTHGMINIFKQAQARLLQSYKDFLYKYKESKKQ